MDTVQMTIVAIGQEQAYGLQTTQGTASPISSKETKLENGREMLYADKSKDAGWQYHTMHFCLLFSKSTSQHAYGPP